MTDYTEFDAALIEAIRQATPRERCVEFSCFAYNQPLRDMATALARPDRYGDRAGWRVTDRRLQALRKAGKLAFDRKTGWRVQ